MKNYFKFQSHLTRYQTLLRNHLSNLNDQLELQIKDQVFSLFFAVGF